MCVTLGDSSRNISLLGCVEHSQNERSVAQSSYVSRTAVKSNDDHDSPD